MSNTKKNRILQLDPAHFHERDGVVFDLESFARHCAPQAAQTAPPPCTQNPIAASQPVCATQHPHSSIWKHQTSRQYLHTNRCTSAGIRLP